METMEIAAVNGSFGEDPASSCANVSRPSTIAPYTMYLVIYSLVFVLGVLGNGVVIWATGFRMKKTVNTVWYLNLAVADFLGTAVMPLAITYKELGGHWPFGWFLCKVSGTVFYTNTYASIYTLTVIGVDRCACVVRPVWAQNHRSVRTASWVSLGVWALALALSSPHYLYRNMTTPPYDENLRWCFDDFGLPDEYVDCTPETKQLRAFRFGVKIVPRFIVGFVVPFTVIVSCYSVIIYRLRNNRSLASQLGRPFRIIATVIAVFFLCWAPFHVINLMKFVNMQAAGYSGATCRVTTIGIPVSLCMALLNSCLNPLLYVFMGRDSKDVFCRSILKVLERAFAEELPPQTNTPTEPGSTSQTNTPTDPGSTSQTNTPTEPGSTSQTNTPTDPGSTSQTNTPTDPGSTSQTNTPTDSGSTSQTNTPTEPGSTSQTNTPTEPGSTSQTNTPTEPGSTSQTNTPTDSGSTSQTNTPTEPGSTSQTNTPTEPGSTSQTNTPTEPGSTSQTNTPTDPGSTSQTNTPTDPGSTSQTNTPTDPGSTSQETEGTLLLDGFSSQ